MLAHGASELDSEQIEVWARAGFDNVYTDMAQMLIFYRDAPLAKRELMVWRLRQFGLERVFFGSEYLMVNPAAGEPPRNALETLTKYPFTQDELDLILGNDGSAWLLGP